MCDSKETNTSGSKVPDSVKKAFEDMSQQMWPFLLWCLQQQEERHGYWTNGQDILCPTEDAADKLADFLEDLGFDVVNTGYFDPEEDARNGETDECTGYWYVSVHESGLFC